MGAVKREVIEQLNAGRTEFEWPEGSADRRVAVRGSLPQQASGRSPRQPFVSEADEVSDEDLEAAADFFDGLVDRLLP